MKIDLNCLKKITGLVLSWITLILLSACSSDSETQGGATAEKIAVPTIEWVMDDSDRKGLGNQRLRKLMAFVDSLKRDELEPTIDRLMTEQAYGRYLEATQMLYARWWKEDREAALEHALAHKGDEQWSALGHVLPLWATEDPMKAWQWVEEKGSQVRSNVGYSILREIVRNDPPLALKLFAESKVIQGSLNDNNPSFLYGTWANHDPAAAAAHLDASSMQPIERSSTRFTIISAWVRRDVDAAWQWAKTAEPAEARLRAMENVVTFLGIRDLEQAETLLNEFPEGQARKSAASSLVATLYLHDPEKAFAILQRHGGGRVEAMILGRWAIRDSEKALEIAKTQLAIGPRQQQAFNEIIGNVARRDIDKAIKILEGFGPQSNLTLGATLLTSRFADQDFEKAKSWAESLPEGEIKNSALSEISSKWVGNSPEEAAAYALAQAADDPSKNLLRGTLQRWAYQDPKASAQWIVENLEDGDQRMHLSSAVGNWAEHEPDAVAKWVAALPEGDVLDACLGRLGSQLGYHHPTKGVEWLEGLKAGKGRDEAISNFASRAFDYFPEVVLQWCTKIEDTQKKKRAVQQNAQKYLRSQPEKARQWIQASSLSDALKKSLIGE